MQKLTTYKGALNDFQYEVNVWTGPVGSMCTTHLTNDLDEAKRFVRSRKWRCWEIVRTADNEIIEEKPLEELWEN